MLQMKLLQMLNQINQVKYEVAAASQAIRLDMKLLQLFKQSG